MLTHMAAILFWSTECAPAAARTRHGALTGRLRRSWSDRQSRANGLLWRPGQVLDSILAEEVHNVRMEKSRNGIVVVRRVKARSRSSG